MPGGHNPRSPVEHGPEVVPVPQLGLAGRQPIRTGNCNSRCASIAAFTADIGDVNAATTPSPLRLNKNPSCASIVLRSTSSCRPGPRASHPRLLPTDGSTPQYR